MVVVALEEDAEADEEEKEDAEEDANEQFAPAHVSQCSSALP